MRIGFDSLVTESNFHSVVCHRWESVYAVAFPYIYGERTDLEVVHFGARLKPEHGLASDLEQFPIPIWKKLFQKWTCRDNAILGRNFTFRRPYGYRATLLADVIHSSQTQLRT